MKEQTILERIELTLGNITYQEQMARSVGHYGGATMWDDIEKLEHCVELLKRGASLQDEFRFVKGFTSSVFKEQ